MVFHAASFKLPDSEKEEFALIVPYTPKEKANMTSLLVARNDNEFYGTLYIYRFPNRISNALTGIKPYNFFSSLFMNE